MRQLLDLPSEVILNILEQVSNADLDNFTSTCSLIYHLALKVLQGHRWRKHHYANITYGDPDWTRDETTWVHPTLMLRDLVAGDLLYYPRAMYVNDNRDGDWDDGRYYTSDDEDDFPHDRRPYTEIDRALEWFPRDIQPLCAASPYLSLGGDKEILAKRIVCKGRIGTTLGFLLTLLPSLDSLHIKDYNKYSSGIEDLKTIIENVIHSNQNASEKFPSKRALSKLRSLTFSRTRGFMGAMWDLHVYAPFFYLPGIRILQADSVMADKDTWSYPGMHSNIEELYFERSDISMECFNTYLKDTKALRNFKYDTHNHGHYDPSLKKLVQNLLEVASHSLHSLDLRGPLRMPDSLEAVHGRPRFIGSLKGFQELKYIKIHASMLIEPLEKEFNQDTYPRDPTPGRPCKLIDILPASTIGLTLHYGSKATVVLAMLRGLKDMKATALPSFKSLEVEDATYLEQEVAHRAIKRTCEESGIDITFKQ